MLIVQSSTVARAKCHALSLAAAAHTKIVVRALSNGFAYDDNAAKLHNQAAGRDADVVMARSIEAFDREIVEADAVIGAINEEQFATAKKLKWLQTTSAGVDVTDPEPLPPGDALWGFSNAIITPHVASEAKASDDRRLAVISDNIGRFARGEPLTHIVDKSVGY